MSFVRYNDAQDIKTPTNLTIKPSSITMRIDVVPVPKGLLKAVTSATREKQYAAIQKIKRAGKDLFLPNNAVVSTNASNRLYQTADLYNPTTSVETLLTQLNENDLTLRLSAIRKGSQSHTTVMNLKKSQLQQLLQGGLDVKNEKSCAVTLPVKDHGTMYVGVRVRKGQHFITKIDYEVNEAFDSKLHIGE